MRTSGRGGDPRRTPLDGDEVIAVARFDRLAPGSPQAEAAFVVADAWQHHGLGAVLLQLVADRARQHGVAPLVAETLGTNRAMQAVFRHRGLPCGPASKAASSMSSSGWCRPTHRLSPMR
jgi:GNAT superfamily N-acetyltransferase